MKLLLTNDDGIDAPGLAALEAAARPLGEHFAEAILYTGGVVGVGLAIQIVLGLFNMYSLKGKLVLLLLAAAAGFGGYVAYEKVVVPHLAEEVGAARAAQEESRKAPQRKSDRHHCSERRHTCTPTGIATPAQDGSSTNTQRPAAASAHCSGKSSDRRYWYRPRFPGASAPGTLQTTP